MARPKPQHSDLSQRRLCNALIDKFGGVDEVAEKAATLFAETNSPNIKAKLLDMVLSAAMSLKDEEPPRVKREDLEAELRQYMGQLGPQGVGELLNDSDTES